ncbi:hypothetical protein EYF80_019311 [Liparis tanakae]|uniref:Uncharacterized protein n=1 Tax=Liparis tanakae TaxID=230148 RepID=A0A4Z2HZJ7_9TELE|nr:hypothetical protein EYF80_019311 [Liparis tanakae]
MDRETVGEKGAGGKVRTVRLQDHGQRHALTHEGKVRATDSAINNQWFSTTDSAINDQCGQHHGQRHLMFSAFSTMDSATLCSVCSAPWTAPPDDRCVQHHGQRHPMFSVFSTMDSDT